ncbi:hypothetical protein Rhopal_002900-T1 [Rhodotorula paludigena]|uniref:histidine kinase n=1 Tax=Rhodotorula paludigena TaxID=86838 RepID=A0AAV5GBE9_9BASI|nr:hypothetical protein Rhopal_002900-T1 [Rhodotorula paludigena]
MRPSPGAPEPCTALPPSSTPSHPTSDLAAFLDSLPLPCCVFEHASVAQDDSLAPPSYTNPALEALLTPSRAASHGVDQSGAEAARAAGTLGTTFVGALTLTTRQELRDWLVEGAAASSSTSSSSASTSAPRRPAPAARPAPPPSIGSRPSLSHTASSNRHIALQLDPLLWFPKSRWRATVYPTFTILTLVPSTETTVIGPPDALPDGPTTPSKTAPAKDAPSAPPSPPADGPPARPPRSTSHPFDPVPPSVLRARQRLATASPSSNAAVQTEQVGEHAVAASSVLDAESVEGIAYMGWNAPFGLYRVNRELSLTQVTPKWRDTVGLAEGVPDDAWPARIHPDDRERVIAHYQQLAAELPLERDEYEFRWVPQGEGESDKWFLSVIEPMVIGGRLEGYCGCLLNIDEHKARLSSTEKRAAQLQAEYAILSEACSVGLTRHALDGTFITVNRAWREITQIDDETPLEKWRDQVHPDDRDRVLAAWAHALEFVEPMTLQFRWKHGTVSLVQCSPNHLEKDKATGWIGSVTDVTARAHVEETMLNLLKERESRAKAEAEQAEERRKVAVEEKRQQELLIDVTSHEIRNPISAILQNADVTRSSLISLRGKLAALDRAGKFPPDLDANLLDTLEEDVEALDAITECGLAQERIANDILGLAQIQLSKYSITPVEFDLATSLRNICRMSAARLTQVLVNLLSNAIRFTAKSAQREVTLAVEVSAKAPDRDAPLIPPHETEYHIDKRRPIYLFFSVEDTGPGMTEEETGRLFAKFMQASPFTHTAWGGSGLGLWIARNLCELQAGRIEVSSTVGKGSIFRCFITARSVDAGPTEGAEKPVPVIEGITGPNAERGAAPKVFLSGGDDGTKAPLSGLKILCCEDNQINRTVLRKQLVKEGCEEVFLACDGREGLEMFKERAPGGIDCILMDIEMPVMDGLEATRVIRTMEQQGERPGRQRIVGLTGNARNAQKQAALDAGMDNVVTKPYKVPELVSRIIGASDPDSVPASPTIKAPSSPEPSATASSTSHREPLVPQETKDAEPLVQTDDKVAVINITGEPALSEGGAEKKAKTMSAHGGGTILPYSQDPEEALEQ